jgi:exonuclease III
MRSVIDTQRRLSHRPAATVCSSPAGAPFETTAPSTWDCPSRTSVDFTTFRLIGIYMPNLLAKIPYWEALIASLSSRSANRALAIGDFNTCRAYLDEAGAIDATARYMDAIKEIGFCDLWRHRHPDQREYSWFSTRSNGFRIDHAFLSQDLAARAGTVHYSHGDRIAGLSDHSPLILELAG